MEFLKSASNDADAKLYAAYVQAGFCAMPNSTRFFIDSAMPGSRLSEKQLGRSLVEYSRWGFEATERRASDVYEKTFLGRYDAATRRRMLARYLDAHEQITPDDGPYGCMHERIRTLAATHNPVDPVGCCMRTSVLTTVCGPSQSCAFTPDGVATCE
jgi:hypothetical protein